MKSLMVIIMVAIAGMVIAMVFLRVKGHGHIKCQEDQVCWNCTTMGNQICG